MPATHLSCTRCGNELQLEGIGACPRCLQSNKARTM